MGRHGRSTEVSASPRRTWGGVGIKGTEVGRVLATRLSTCPFQVPSVSQCGDLKKKRKCDIFMSKTRVEYDKLQIKVNGYCVQSCCA